MRLSGVAAIVTGGGSGLGRATAEALAAKGARVAVFDLNPAAADEAARAIGGVALVGDVADEASASAAIRKQRRRMGPPECWSIAPGSASPNASSAATGRNPCPTSRR